MKNKILTIALILAVCMSVVGVVKAVDGLVQNFGDVENIYIGGGDTTEGVLGGNTGLDNLVLDGTLTVGEAVTLTGAATLSSTLTVADETNLERVHSGGTVTNASSTMQVALTLTAAQVCDSSVIHVNSTNEVGTIVGGVAASLDITFPATSTLFADCLDDDGDTTEFIFYNSSPTAATTTQIVAGTGGYLYVPDGQNVEIGGGNAVIIKLQRFDTFETNEDLIITVDELIAG